MHTETEAAKLWCPHVRHDNDTCTPNRYTPPGQSTDIRDWNACIASRCMMWRWSAPAREEMRIYHASETYRKRYGSVDVGSAFRLVNGMPWFYEHTSVDELGVFDLLTREKHGAEPLGYCGLAGKPD